MKTTTRKAKNGREIRLVGIADSHLTCFDPPSWKSSFMQESESILDQVFKFAIKNNVDAIIHAGDFFHLKSPARNPLHFLVWTFNKLRELRQNDIEMWGVGGNHDLKFGSLKGLGGQPLETLIAAGLFHLLDEEELLICTEGEKPTSLRVAGASFEHGLAEPTRLKKKQGATYLEAVGHFWFGAASGEFMGEPLYGPDFLKTGEADVYFIGHHHEDQGVQKLDEKWYVAHGSINRTGGKESDLTRRPAASYQVFTEEGIKIQTLRPKVKDPKELIDFDARKQIMQERKDIEEFVASLHGMQVKALDPNDVLKEMDVQHEVRQLAQWYLTEAEKTTEGKEIKPAKPIKVQPTEQVSM